MTDGSLRGHPTTGAWYADALRFPLRPWLWPLIVAAAAISGLVSLVLPRLPAIPAGLLALATMVTLWVLALRVASRILLATADGAGLEREYREYDTGEFQALRQIGLWFFIALILAALNQSLGPLAILIALPALALLMPAMTALVARHNRLGALVERENWRKLPQQVEPIESRHLSGLFVALGLIYLALDWVTSALLPVALTNAAMMAVWVYSLWVFFYAIGQVLREARGPAREAGGASDTGESIEQLSARVLGEGGTLDDYRRLMRALEQNANEAGLREHGPGFISALLLAHGRGAEAVERAAGLVDLDPRFVLGVPSAQLKLIEAARAYGHPDLVVQLASAYLDAWPAAPDGREARLIACETRAQDPDSKTRSWFNELIQDSLTDKEKERLRAIAAAYVYSAPKGLT